MNSHTSDEEDDHLTKDLLEVLLCGFGAAAALMILYSVMPKAGDSTSPAGAEPERAATRQEKRDRRKPVAPGDSLTQIWVEAESGSGLSPSAIALHGLEGGFVQHWTEGRDDIGWRCVFLMRRRAEEINKLELVCKAGSTESISTGARLKLRVGVDSDLYLAEAVYYPAPPVKGQPAAAGTFLITAGANTPPLPPQPQPSTFLPRSSEVSIITVYPANAEVPLRGTTPFES